MKNKLAAPTKFIGENGRLVDEKTEGFLGLSFLYATLIGKAIRPLINRRFINIIYAWYQNSRLSRRKIAPFIAKHHIKIDDFEQPGSGYQSFNDFFIRKLKPGRRTIDARPEILVSPADSKLLVIPAPKSIQGGYRGESPILTFFIKEQQFTLETFLQDKKLAGDYANATMFIFRLAPYDYHRFHFPTNGVPEAPIIISGRFDSVNPLVYKSGVQPLHSNERHIIKLQTQHVGQVLMVPVGALMVGKIVETYAANQRVVKGDEAGYFAFGGSTVVVLVKPGVIQIKENFVKNSEQGFETVVKMGQGIGKKL